MELDYIWDTKGLLDNFQESNSINNPWKRKQVIWCRTTELKILWKEWILRILESYSLFLLKIKVTPPPFKWMRWNKILFPSPPWSIRKLTLSWGYCFHSYGDYLLSYTPPPMVKYSPSTKPLLPIDTWFIDHYLSM